MTFFEPLVRSAWHRCLPGVALVLALGLTGTAGLATASAARAFNTGVQMLPPLLVDDEPVVVTQHRIMTRHGPLTYEARAGRIPIRNADTGELRARIFYTAYVVKGHRARRPLTFAWSGGPLVASSLTNVDGFGPRLRVKDRMVDNPDTLLGASDLVFMDAVGTGFSRPAKPGYAFEFMNMQGDVRATVEFIAAYRRRFDAGEQPLFIEGGSYGAFRGAAVADALTARHQPLAGVILISGDVPNIPQSVAFYDAMHVPARTAAAFFHRRLDGDLMRNRAATMAAAVDWAKAVYRPALERIDTLSPAERETIARDLARYTGLRPEQVDHKTLVVYIGEYLTHAMDATGNRALSEEDLRVIAADDHGDDGYPEALNRYLRGELGYRSDLVYAGVESGYAPFLGPKLATIREQWSYNQPGVTSDVIARFKATGEVSPLARANPPWIVNALKQDPALRVFIGTARFDPLNMCEGNVLAVAQLPSALSQRISLRCYESGHIIYRDPTYRRVLLEDIARFISTRAAGTYSQEKASE